MPFPKGKYKVLTLDIPKDLLDGLRAEAKKRRASLSRVITDLLVTVIKRLKEKHGKV